MPASIAAAMESQGHALDGESLDLLRKIQCTPAIRYGADDPHLDSIWDARGYEAALDSHHALLRFVARNSSLLLLVLTKHATARLMGQSVMASLILWPPLEAKAELRGFRAPYYPAEV